ncbi:MAG: DUF1273 family protein [Clostridia bacterium]|nr:DUF1273 family protein [Clostridia bacterium]
MNTSLIHKSCCFIGHRKIIETKELKQRLKNTLENLIKEKQVRTFIFGSRSEFDFLCHTIVSNLMNIYPTIKRVVYTCKSELAVLKHDKEELEQMFSNAFKQDITLCEYEKEIEHKTKFTSGKASYIERNKAMIDASDYCIFYYDENYKPQKRKHSKNDVFEYQPKSGTSLAYNYAKQKKKNILVVNF